MNKNLSVKTFNIDHTLIFA